MIKKIIILSLVAMCAGLEAFSASSELEILEKQLDAITMDTKEGTKGLLFVSTRPNQNGLFLSVDALVWQSKISGLAYGASNLIFKNAPIDSVSTVVEPHFNWNGGVKAAAGYNLDYDNWDLVAEYTYFQNKAHGACRTTLPSGISLLNTQLYNFAAPSQLDIAASFLVPGYVANGVSNLTLTINDLHFELGRDFYLSDRLSIRPNMGVQVLWLAFQQNTNYTGGGVAYTIGGKSLYGLDFLGVGEPTLSYIQKNNITAVGPRFGFNSHWPLLKGFGFYADIYESLLYSFLGRKVEATFTGYPDNLYQDKYNIKHILPLLAFELGLAYNRDFFDNAQRLIIHIGYENQFFFNLLNMNYELLPDSLGVYGVNIKAGWEF